MLSLQVKLTQDQGQHQQEHWHLLKGTSHSALGPQRNARAGAGDKGQTKACTQHHAEPSAIRLTTAYAAHKLTCVNICTTLCCSLSTDHLLPATTYHYGPQVHLHPVSACLAGTRQFFYQRNQGFLDEGGCHLLQFIITPSHTLQMPLQGKTSAGVAAVVYARWGVRFCTG